MATSSTYYLNAPSLASATSVFTDDALLINAADGFYSDGVISRELFDSVLLPQVTCPICPSPPPAESYNCVEGVCTDPGDGTGTYSTLGACEADCGIIPPAESYNCVEGTCTDPGDGTGTYSTLGACEAVCSPPPPISYNCITGNCIDPGDGTGEYPTLVDCQLICGGITCTDWEIYNGTGLTIYWSGTTCAGSSTGPNPVTPGNTITTGCIIDGTLTNTGGTVTVNAYC